MMNFQQIEGILDDVEFEGWKVIARFDSTKPYLQLQFEADGHEWRGRKWMLSYHMTKSEIVQTALAAVLAAVEHEAREHFLYRGQAIFGPHFDVDALHVFTQTGFREVRSEA